MFSQQLRKYFFIILLCSIHVINYINRFPNIASLLFSKKKVSLAIEHFLL